MTIEERIARIEHLTAGLDERQRQEREEDRALWRESQQMILATQRQIADTHMQLAILTRRVADVEEQMVRTDEKLRQVGEETDRKLRTLGEQTDKRISDLVSAIGELIKRNGKH